MSRPLLLSALALVLGILVADRFFNESSAAVPHWLNGVLWIVCAFLALLAVIDFRQRQRFDYNPARRFAVLIALFFFVLGFMRYTMVAERTQAVWQQMRYPPVNHGNPDEMDYRRWRWVQGEPDSTALLAGLRKQALDVRQQMVDRYRLSGLQDEALAVVTAMTLGDRSLLTTDTRTLFADAGASHLLALSGLHLGILTGLLFVLFNSWLLCSRWRWLVGLLSIGYVWAYVFVAGWPASLVRAALLSTVFITASFMQRRCHPLQLLLLTAFLMLLCWPMYLFDVGAQLSFLAVTGIIVLFRPAYQWLFEHGRFLMFRLERWHLTSVISLLGVSLSAQVFTLPIVMITFHRIPLYGVLFSVLLIPLTTVLVLTALAVLLVGSVWLAAGQVLAQVLTWLVTAQMWIMQTQVQLPGACINDFWSQKAEPQLVIYHNRRCPALHLIGSPEQSWLLMPQPERADSGLYYIRRDFWQRRLTAEPQVLTGRHAIVVKGMSAVMVNSAQITDEANESQKSHETGKPHAPHAIDVLWITRGFRGSRLDRLSTFYKPRLLVLDASLQRWQRQALQKEAIRVGWPLYDIAEQGALRLQIKE